MAPADLFFSEDRWGTRAGDVTPTALASRHNFWIHNKDPRFLLVCVRCSARSNSTGDRDHQTCMSKSQERFFVRTEEGLWPTSIEQIVAEGLSRIASCCRRRECVIIFIPLDAAVVFRICGENQEGRWSSRKSVKSFCSTLISSCCFSVWSLPTVGTVMDRIRRCWRPRSKFRCSSETCGATLVQR